MSPYALELARMLSSRGLKLTPQRKAVLDVVAAAEVSVSPAQVYDAARALYPDLGLTTVYRTLDILVGLGALRRVQGGSHSECYTTAQSVHGHSVLCRTCGRVSEFTHCDMDGVLAAAAQQPGFAIDEHFLQLTGECAGCAASSCGRERS